MTLTTKQKQWDWLKAEARADRANRRRPLRLPMGPPQRQPPPGRCLGCNHTKKHHKQTGHCRPGCDCPAAAIRKATP